MSGAPRRRHWLSLDVHADSWDDLARELHLLADEIERRGDDMTTERTMGTVSSGLHLRLVTDPDMTPERFAVENAEYVKARRGRCCG